MTETKTVLWQQDHTDIEPGLDGGANVSQRSSSDGSDHSIAIVGRGNLVAFIAALQKLAEAPHD
jgi:hypothetical protein